MITNADYLLEISRTFPSDAWEGDFRAVKLRAIADKLERLEAAAALLLRADEEQRHCDECDEEEMLCPDKHLPMYTDAVLQLKAALGRKETTT